MNKPKISALCQALIELIWYFGPKGLNGECCENLSMPEFMALSSIAGIENCPVQNIGYSLGFTKSGATRIVNRLESKGYVKKIKSSADARVCCVEITGSGAKVIKDTDAVYLQNLEKLLANMPAKSAMKAKEVLTSLAKSIEEMKESI